MSKPTSADSAKRGWEPWVFIVGAIVLGLLILAFYLASPDSFPEDFLPGFS